MTVSDNTIEAKGLGSFFINLGKISGEAGKNLATSVLKSPGELLKAALTLLKQQLLEISKV